MVKLARNELYGDALFTGELEVAQREANNSCSALQPFMLVTLCKLYENTEDQAAAVGVSLPTMRNWRFGSLRVHPRHYGNITAAIHRAVGLASSE